MKSRIMLALSKTGSCSVLLLTILQFALIPYHMGCSEAPDPPERWGAFRLLPTSDTTEPGVYPLGRFPDPANTVWRSHCCLTIDTAIRPPGEPEAITQITLRKRGFSLKWISKVIADAGYNSDTQFVISGTIIERTIDPNLVDHDVTPHCAGCPPACDPVYVSARRKLVGLVAVKKVLDAGAKAKIEQKKEQIVDQMKAGKIQDADLSFNANDELVWVGTLYYYGTNNHGCCSPATAIQLLGYTAILKDGFVEIKWRTETEFNTAGFNLYRSLDEKSEKVPVNDTVLPAKGDETRGAEYVYIDSGARNGHTCVYWLEDIDLSGGRHMHEPVVAVSDGGNERIPARFAMTQNIPNPFNPSTEIRYDLPIDCHVFIAIYNVQGRRIVSLVDEHQNAGSRTVRWYGRDANGDAVASGIYFYRLTAGSETLTRKAVLLK